MFQGTIYLYASPLVVLIILRLLMGAIEAPAFPANSRLSVQWFPNNERGLVTSVYQAAQYNIVRDYYAANDDYTA